MSTPFLKILGGLEVTLLQCAHTSGRQPAFERQVEFPAERIGHQDLGVLPLLEMFLRLRRVPETAYAIANGE